MTTQDDKDTGVIAAALRRLEIEHLPRALELKAKVDNGETLNDLDLNFIGRIYEEIRKLGSVIERHREYMSLATKMINLCDEVTKKAMENEQSR